MNHVTRSGESIPITQLSDSHLRNVIRYIEKRSADGVVVSSGGGSWEGGDMWYDEKVLYGDEALRSLNYHHYTDELHRRTKT